jgi:hypothetical protein
MLKQSILSVTPAFAIATAIVLATPAAPAFAQYWPGTSRDTSYQSRAYDYGYRDGLARGEQDGRSNRAYSLDQSREYQNADRGYERREGNLRTYQQTYRNAFATGYREGYERYNRGGTVYGGIGGGGYGRNGQRYPSYPSNGRNNPYGYGYSSPGFDAGYSDGYEQGAEDGEDRDRFDPMRHGRYKSADRGYNRQYGSKDAYKNTYREGFRSGYERGYRDSQQYGSRGARTTRQSPGWWPF